MSGVIAAPELMAEAATYLATIGSNLSAAHSAAAARTLAVLPAAADEVSASIAQLFSQYARDYQALAAKAGAFEEQLVQILNASAGAYANIEAAIASWLQYFRAAEGYVVSTVVANPNVLFTPLPYEFAIAPVIVPILTPFLLIGLIVIVYYLASNGLLY
jgi:hypothetical protein